ncbi:3-methyl-2-oxobutanoate hydroxymethyltransferase [Candidatus Ruthia endofausta]|uniref:3-methyl-2-oxobutanoate hydroxymethyltransferase n=1 Tax=Candidatus Ruthia endofausta TaxID=2738852 RepID=A0A6N0HNH8_9GAMM|nr:3-methyl-2-oxobutanoate hydroxymethyltransferase [Candidatus Ruthia endofausta]QKQ23898.1 3-methyl-2-oxobutanoate hydroxymethyltransferase [Candidatus Ruthia endofausta]
MNIKALKTFKQSGEKIACLTAYDASFASVFDMCGIDIVLIGDSLGNVIQGGENTLGVSMDDMIYHTQAVAKGAKNTLRIVDMPYQSYTNTKQTLTNAKRLIMAGAQMVKLEGGCEHEASFKILQDNDISVCGHLGLQPQSVIEMGGYKVQGREKQSADKITKDALALASWDVKAIVLECIPAELAKQVSQSLSIPTIGIGAGVNCDGQVLVSHDMLGIHVGHVPKFVKNFLTNNDDVKSAVSAFIKAVKDKSFPSRQHSY